MKNYEDQGGCYIAEVDNTLRDLHNDSFHFFLSLRAGEILQILQSDWFRERAVFYDLAR